MGAHKGPDEIVYHLSDDAMSVFTSFHDDIVIRRQSIPDDENRRGVLSKAKGQLARFFHVFEQAVGMCSSLDKGNDEDLVQEWSFCIQDTTVNHAVELINHFIDQKSVMPEEEKFEEVDTCLAQLSSEQVSSMSTNGPYIRKPVLCKHDHITPSTVSQLRLMPPSSNETTPGKTRYPAVDAKRFLRNVVDLGLGTLQTERVERMTSKGPVSGKHSVRMLKRRFSELEPQPLAILKRLKVTEEEYKSACTTLSANTCTQPSSSSDDHFGTPLGNITNTLS